MKVLFKLLFLILIFFCFPYSSLADSAEDSWGDAGTGGTPPPDNRQGWMGDPDLLKLQKAFFEWQGIEFGFSESAETTQILKQECPNQYSSIQRMNINRTDYKAVVQSAENIIGQCRETLVQNYKQKAYENPESDPPVSPNQFQIILSVFANHTVNNSPNDSPDWAKDVKEFISAREQFYNDCIRGVFDNLSLSNIQDRFRRLRVKNCHQRKAYQLGFITSIMTAFNNSLDSCRNSSNSCVTNLRQFVALDPMTDGVKRVFPNCANERGETRKCCSGSTECESFSEIQDKYSSAIQTVARSPNRQCSPTSPDLQNMESEMSRDILKICENSSSECQTNCQAELDQFKQEFLECFFMPSFREGAFEHHRRNNDNKCSPLITEIKAEYHKLTNKKKHLSLGSVSSEMPPNCESPLIALKEDQRHQTQLASQTIQNLCGSQPEAYTAGNFNFPSPKDTDRNSNSRDPSSISGDTRNPYSPFKSSGGSGGSYTGSVHKDSTGDNPSGAVLPLGGKDSVVRKDENFPTGFDEEAYKRQLDSMRAEEREVHNQDYFDELFDEEKDYFPDFENTQYGVLEIPDNTDEGTESDFKVLGPPTEEELERAEAKYSNYFSEETPEQRPLNFGEKMLRGALYPFRKPIKKFVKARKKPVPTIQEVFRVNGPDVDLRKLQKELILEFCKTMPCNGLLDGELAKPSVTFPPDFDHHKEYSEEELRAMNLL